MKQLIWILLFAVLSAPQISSAQNNQITRANYALAARFSPKKLEKLIFSTAVDAHWLKKSNRFWYMYETTAGKKWFIVDPVKGEKKPLFDNADLAAKITAIVKDPFDAQHLGLDSMRFIKDENTIRFEVKSTKEVEKKDSTQRRGNGPAIAPEKKVFYFEYNLLTSELTELTDFKKTKRKPIWASISPDSSTIVFGKGFNLYYMDRSNYLKALQNEEDSSIVEYRLTTDGVEYYSYHGESALGGGGENNIDKEKNKNKRKPTQIYWSPDSKYFVMTRSDNRKVKDLWVINSIAEPRPTIETYKYLMPGEKDHPVDELTLFDLSKKSHQVLSTGAYKDQTLSIWSAPSVASNRDDDYRVNYWLGTSRSFYFTRTSRDLKRIDVCMADPATGMVKPLIKESLNTYVEVRRLGLVNEGKELIEWSERDGWAHFYLYDENGQLKNRITQGAFHCEDIVGIDDKKRVLYFTANGREENEDPYYLHI